MIYVSVCRHSRDAREGSQSLYARVGGAHPASMVGHKLDKKSFYQNNLKTDNWNFEILQNQTVLLRRLGRARVESLSRHQLEGPPST